MTTTTSTTIRMTDREQQIVTHRVDQHRTESVLETLRQIVVREAQRAEQPHHRPARAAA